jgi:hypothetical protein
VAPPGLGKGSSTGANGRDEGVGASGADEPGDSVAAPGGRPGRVAPVPVGMPVGSGAGSPSVRGMGGKAGLVPPAEAPGGSGGSVAPPCAQPAMGARSTAAARPQRAGRLPRDKGRALPAPTTRASTRTAATGAGGRPPRPAAGTAASRSGRTCSRRAWTHRTCTGRAAGPRGARRPEIARTERAARARTQRSRAGRTGRAGNARRGAGRSGRRDVRRRETGAGASAGIGRSRPRHCRSRRGRRGLPARRSGRGAEALRPPGIGREKQRGTETGTEESHAGCETCGHVDVSFAVFPGRVVPAEPVGKTSGRRTGCGAPPPDAPQHRRNSDIFPPFHAGHPDSPA